jgi:xylulokinase
VYLTFDIGTTSVKVVLYAPDGRLVRKSIRNFTIDTPRADWYEADPSAYWQAVVDGTRVILSPGDIDPADIRTFSGCSQGETVIFLDTDEHPVRPAIVWLDHRARGESEELAALASRDELYATTGQTDFDPTWTAAKILWVKKNEPKLFEKTARFLLVEDYITLRLTGRACSTANLLSSSLLADVHAGRYWSRTVDFLGVGSRLPEIMKPGDPVGTLTQAAADDLGLLPGTLVVKGAMDQATSAIGAGNLTPGIVTETTGSVMAIGVTNAACDLGMATRLPYQPHILSGSILYLPYLQTAGSAYKWWRDMFCQEEIRAEGDCEAAYATMDARAATVPAGSEGVVFLPFLAGAGQPENDPDARGVFYGLTLKQGKNQCTRAIMESIAYVLRKLLSDLHRSGIPISEVRSMGGGARSDLWLQIKADVIGVPVVRMEEEETSTLGAAILAAVCVGDYPDLASAAAAMVRLGTRFLPSAAARADYERAFALYNGLYTALAPVFKRFSRHDP